MSSAAYNTLSTTKANTNGLKPVCIDPSNIEYFSSNYSGAMHKLHSGGIDRANRGICVISVALAELPADPKCQFSA